jgi:hypothetical protein
MLAMWNRQTRETRKLIPQFDPRCHWAVLWYRPFFADGCRDERVVSRPAEQTHRDSQLKTSGKLKQGDKCIQQNGYSALWELKKSGERQLL